MGHLKDYWREGNRIGISGHFGADLFRIALSMVHQAVNDRGYRDYVLDFSKCTAAFPVAMLPVCAQALMFTREGVDASLVLPSDPELERLFFNANWANLIDDRRPTSTFRGYLQVPATVFKTSSEQFALVNKVIESILRSTPELVREDLAAIEWAFNEITDNVLNHSRSEIGGIIQFSTRAKSKRIEFAVCDGGIGVAASLRPSHPEIPNDLESLAWSIREGVTRDPEVGQGNGLFGSSQICRLSGGFFSLHSDRSEIWTNDPTAFTLRNYRVPVHGTVVDVCISYAVPNVLQQALKFQDGVFRPIDYIETHYEMGEESGAIVLQLIKEADSLGARKAGRPIRTKLVNLVHMTSDVPIKVNFDGVSVVSSSFADEAFGKLGTELGIAGFPRRVELVNMTKTVSMIVSRAIAQRGQATASDG